MNFKISKAAAADLEQIWLYTVENWSIEQADRYYNLILDEIESLAAKKQTGIDCSDIRKGYFKSRVKSHFVFYKINVKKQELEVIRILHQSMDLDSRLNE